MDALPPEPLSTAVEPVSVAPRTFALTFGATPTQKNWTDRRTVTWPALAERLTKHEVGPKEGSCIVPAIFRGTRRHKADADQIDVVVLDSDCGHTLEEIDAAVRTRGWAAIVHSTHSHLTTTTCVKKTAWDKFSSVHLTDAERLFLIDKGYLPRVAVGARVVSVTDTEVTFEHAPCPKFRIVLRLATPWRAADFPDQRTANAAWKERIEALAAALGLSHDQSCTDTSRLFYLPRYPNDGRAPVAAVIDGADCDIWTLPRRAQPAQVSGASASKSTTIADTGEFTDPETGEIIDLRQWAKAHGKRFEIVKALKARTGDVFIGHVTDGAHYHIRCANEDAHTTTGSDRATIVVNASEANNKGFVYHCRHAHCTGKDRLFFVRRMLEQDWLKIEDLTSTEFLAVTDDGEHPQQHQQHPKDAANEPPDSAAKADDASADTAGEDRVISEGNVAAAFARLLNDRLRYCHHAGAWYRWNGAIWQKEETKLAYRWAHQLACKRAKGSGNFKAILQAGKASFAAGVERIAQSDRVFAVTSAVWNTKPLLLGTPDGTVDLRTGELRQAQQADMITKSTAVAPAARADCPQWLAFLNEVTAGDTALVGFLKRWFGYCLTGQTHEHALLFLYGPGGNGKGVLLNTIADILGSYATTAAMDTFTVSHGDRHPTDLAMLHGARLVISTETEEGRAWAEARIKALTGGDPITARFMRRDFFTFKPEFKLTISGNHKPTLRNVDDAARRRLNIAPFENKPAVPDKMLPEKLKAEWPGILRWMIEGYLEWQRDGLNPPEVVRESTSEYFEQQDIFAQWLDEYCERDQAYGDTSSNLFASWRAYATSRAEDAHTSKWFATMLERQGFRRDKDCDLFRGRGFRGVRVKPNAPLLLWADRDG